MRWDEYAGLSCESRRRSNYSFDNRCTPPSRASVAPFTNALANVHMHRSAEVRTKEEREREKEKEKKKKKENSPRPAAQEQTGARDVLGRADAAGGVRLGELGADGVEDGAHHLAGEGPAGEGVDGDAARAQGEGHGPGEVVQAGLGRRVGVVLERGDAQGVDAADVLFGEENAWVGVSVIFFWGGGRVDGPSGEGERVREC